MKRLLIIAACLIFSANVFAQQVKPIYFNGNEVVADMAIANGYGIYGRVGPDSVYVLKRYNLYNELLSTEVYKDEALKIKHGEFVYYMDFRDFNYQNMNFQNNASLNLKDKTRFIYRKGKYDNDKEVGKWMMFYPNGKTMRVINYEQGKKNGLYASFDLDGNVVETGSYVMDKKDGEWLYIRGRKRELYDKGVLLQEQKLKESKATVTVN